MTGKHRRPHAGPGRALAATAAVLAAGALPLAAAGSAFAAQAPAAAGGAPAALQLIGEPGLQQVAQPLQAGAPLIGAVAQDLGASVASGQLPVEGLGGAATPRMRAGDAAVDRATAAEAADLAGKASALAGRVTPALPASGLLGQVAPAMVGAKQQAALPKLLPDTAVGTFNGDLAAKASGAAEHLAQRMSPVVQQLHGNGVPTVGDVTGGVGGTRMPLYGTVGGLTSAMPVGQLLGDNSPLIGVIGTAGGL